MASVNKAILIGNLGADPELRYTPTGEAVTKFRIATTEKFKDRDGNLKESTEWHNIVCWRRQAEIANEYLKKGNPVYIEGSIKTRSYDDKNGVKRYITEIITQRLQLLGSRGQGQPTAQGQPAQAQDAPEPTMPAEDDDLPF